MTPSTTRRQRLERAGWIRIEGWVPDGPRAKKAKAWIAESAAEAERIATTGQRGRGRPRKPQE